MGDTVLAELLLFTLIKRQQGEGRKEKRKKDNYIKINMQSTTKYINTVSANDV